MRREGTVLRDPAAQRSPHPAHQPPNLLQANQRNVELAASIVEYIASSRGARPASAQKTPYNPVFNPCYALTDTARAVRAQLAEAGESVAPSTGPEQRKVWHFTKSKELEELEAALKSLPRAPRSASARRPSGAAPAAGTPAGAATLAPATRLTGTKRKASDAAAATPVTDAPSAKRGTPGSAAANTLVLKNQIIRRPGRPKARGPSRLGLSSSTAAVPAAAPAPAPPPPAAAPARTPAAVPGTVRRPSAAPAATAARASAAARASRAHEAYVARMRGGQQGTATPASARR